MIVIFIYLEYNQPTLRYIADEIDKKLEELLAIRGKCGKKTCGNYFNILT